MEFHWYYRNGNIGTSGGKNQWWKKTVVEKLMVNFYDISKFYFF